MVSPRRKSFLTHLKNLREEQKLVREKAVTLEKLKALGEEREEFLKKAFQENKQQERPSEGVQLAFAGIL